VNCVGSYAAVALVAERIDGWHVQQAGVLGTVRSVAPKAPFSLYRDVFVDKRPTRLGVAPCADRVLVGGGLHVVGSEGAVHIVAIAALDQAFVHLVVEWHIERWLSVRVALEAKRRLRSFQQLFFLALMNAVAAGTADVRFGVGRAVKVRVRPRVTGQALGVNLFSRVLSWIEDLARVAAALHMRLASAVAVLTSNACAGVAMHQRHFGMRVFWKSFGYFRVTAGAGCVPNKWSSVRARNGCLALRIGLCPSNMDAAAQDYKRDSQESLKVFFRSVVESRYLISFRL
jgi:GNAT superfamily N-acetyltransferase